MAISTIIIATTRKSNGQVIRLQKRGSKFDAIINSTGLCWRYLKKAVSENEARAEYDRWRDLL